MRLYIRLDWVDGWPTARAGLGASETPQTAPVATGAEDFEDGLRPWTGRTWQPGDSGDDAGAVAERPNMPGTVTQWPNWRLALPRPVEDLLAEPLAREVASILDARKVTAPAG